MQGWMSQRIFTRLVQVELYSILWIADHSSFTFSNPVVDVEEPLQDTATTILSACTY